MHGFSHFIEVHSKLLKALTKISVNKMKVDILFYFNYIMIYKMYYKLVRSLNEIILLNNFQNYYTDQEK